MKAESLSVPALVNEMEANAVVTHLRQKYPEPPTAIVMIGDPDGLFAANYLMMYGKKFR